MNSASHPLRLLLPTSGRCPTGPNVCPHGCQQAKTSAPPSAASPIDTHTASASNSNQKQAPEKGRIVLARRAGNHSPHRTMCTSHISIQIHNCPIPSIHHRNHPGIPYMDEALRQAAISTCCALRNSAHIRMYTAWYVGTNDRAGT